VEDMQVERDAGAARLGRCGGQGGVEWGSGVVGVSVGMGGGTGMPAVI
jgi:hypothetical protein